MLLAALAAACATSDDPSTDTESDPTVTASFTSTDPTADPTTDPTNDPTNDPTDPDPSTTTGMDDTTGGTEGATGTGSGSTGECMPGTENCACAEMEPVCEEGLLCELDVCVVPECPMDLDEPNGLQGEAIMIADINDGAGPQQHTGTLSGFNDVDWWSYHCTDALLQGLNPVQALTSSPGAQFCVYLDCDIGGNPTFAAGCPEGTTEDTAPLDFMPGCCSSDGLPIDLSELDNCPDSSDDSLTIYFRVDTAEEDVCIDYTIDFEC